MENLPIEACVAIAEGVYLEGLAVDHAHEGVWYSDVVGGGVHGILADGSRVTLNECRMWTGGVFINHDGKVLSTGQGGIMWNDPATGASGWLLDTLEGAPVNGINEIAPDGHGGIYFGTVDLERVLEGGETRPTAIWRLARDRSLTRVAEGLNFSNGLVHDIARRRFFASDTFACAHAWNVAEDGSFTDHRALAERPDCDGMALDAEGNVLVTSVGSQEITRYSPEGETLPGLSGPMPGCITQIRFGGEDGRDVWFNCGSLEAVEALKAGKPVPDRSSRLFRGRSPIAGQPIPPAQFDLA